MAAGRSLPAAGLSMIAFDTSMLLAAEGRHGAGRRATALAILSRMTGARLLVPAQALAEMSLVLRRFYGEGEDEAAATLGRWLDAGRSAGVSAATVQIARALEKESGLPLDSALMIAAAQDAGAALLLSEDLPDGLQFGQMIVADPFRASPHPALEAALGPGWCAPPPPR